jgi:hypothetical protein
MYRYLCATAALLLSLAGCASFPDVNRERLESLPQHYAQFDAVLAWEVRGVGAETVIDGEFKNIRYSAMDNVEVWVEVLDPAGKTVARSVGFVVPHLLRLDDIAPFTMKLPVSAVPGTNLRFTYRYRGLDGGGPDGGGDVENWMQSFDAVIPGSR